MFQLVFLQIKLCNKIRVKHTNRLGLWYQQKNKYIYIHIYTGSSKKKGDPKKIRYRKSMLTDIMLKLYEQKQ